MIRSSFVTASLALLAAMQQPAESQAPLPTLRVGCTASDTYGSGYFARDMGYFNQVGLNVDLETLGNGAAIAAGVVSGAISVGIAPPNVVANGYLHGLPFAIIAAAGLTTPTARSIYVCASKSSGIRTARDLENKTIGVNGLGILDFQLDAWFAQAGADSSKVKLAEVPFSEMGSALARGTVDAATMTAFSLTVARKQYDLQVLGDLEEAIAPQYLDSCWFTTRDFARDNTDLLRRFTRAIYAAQRWANGHHDESAVILSKYSKIDVTIIRSMSRVLFAEQLRVSDIQPLLDAAAKYGALAHPVSAQVLIYPL